MLDKLIAILEQVRAELPARAREIVQRLEVKQRGKLSGYTVALTQWLAAIGRGSKSLVSVVQAHG